MDPFEVTGISVTRMTGSLDPERSISPWIAYSPRRAWTAENSLWVYVISPPILSSSTASAELISAVCLSIGVLTAGRPG